jgi:hypothetical protein
MVVLLWMLWFLNSVIQTTWLVLMKQVRCMTGTSSTQLCTKAGVQWSVGLAAGFWLHLHLQQGVHEQE